MAGSSGPAEIDLADLNTGQSQAGFHRLDLLMWCPRAFGFREVGHIVPVLYPRGPALGCAAHAGLATHYLGLPWSDGLKDAPKQWAWCVPDSRQLLQAYVETYAYEPFDIIAVEHELSVLLDGEYLFTRRVDLLVRSRRDGLAYVYDHKTAGRIRDRMRSVQFDGALFTQDILGALVVPQEFGLQWGGVVLNLIETSGKNWAFKRAPLRFPPPVIKSALASLKHWSKYADDLVKSGMDPWDYPQSWHCQANYGCDYRELCAHGPAALSRYEVEVG